MHSEIHRGAVSSVQCPVVQAGSGVEIPGTPDTDRLSQTEEDLGDGDGGEYGDDDGYGDSGTSLQSPDNVSRCRPLSHVNTLQITPIKRYRAGDSSASVNTPRFTLDAGINVINTRRMGSLTVRSFGTTHPYFNSNCTRIPASDEERSWLFDYFTGDTDIYLEQRGNIFRKCLDCIRSDDAARSLFHERHVHNSDRLKTISLPVIATVKMYRDQGLLPEWYLTEEVCEGESKDCDI